MIKISCPKIDTRPRFGAGYPQNRVRRSLRGFARLCTAISGGDLTPNAGGDQ